MEAEKVNVEIVDIGKEKKISKFFKKIKSILIRIKLGIAIILDGIDFLIGWIPIVNTLWDIVTFLILLITLKNKKLAFVSLVELPFFGLPPFSIIDMFIPIATITVLIDNNLGNINIQKFKA
ncbi:MAG: hypothetical protein QF655_03195 [Candidatus Woesearchaeota archaeon]|jgi:hypothetical protein|nr:hypothetical protein [Candidatus Woesearchaeota archaeon]MDP6265174.1 hypothetical protein [Candidatus Woesearchaeota archaeon]MDP7322565.1 hypothetical protein [Candidatus Woesearchaeota archaeon]MDP7476606.1 hypothetical protein [Candidatus Woesearchaeota archaeon]HJO01746.1 hypothetical protein [Candidatus Woesearchaeota archaeon]|tara:strand:+ start:3890 stop:4255 length:366 start_codon:yes stop_codon:yes gene_type:complete